MLEIRRYFDWFGNEGTHRMLVIPSNSILKESLGPFVSMCKYVGILPIQIFEDGSASFKIIHLPFAFYLLFLGLFTTGAYFYSPFYLDITSRDTQETIFEVAKYLFVCGQFAAAVGVALMVPRLSRRLTKFWNRLQQVLILISKQPTASARSREHFIPVYRSARRAVAYWITINISSWYLWNKTFHLFFKGYFQSSSITLYVLAMGGCLGLATLIATHVLHSFLFILFASVIKGALKCLRELPIEGQCPLFEQKSEVADGVELYEALCRLIQRLGQIYGRYLIIEMCALFTAVLTNVFAMLSGFDSQGVTWETTVVSLTINMVWFYFICEAGESLYKEQARCLKALKNSAVFNKMSEGWMIAKFVAEEPLGVSAANYFRISRKLMTQVTGSAVMYLIVMLQFKSTSSTNFLRNNQA